ncbi:MAG: hypothetical protein Q9178_002986 [Gyalolechia marmorata]
MSGTVSDLASGSQDLAALLGLFCTDGVERNALACSFGYGTVVASSLSLLGVLGLVKSSIKLALGLKRCEQAGFNLDSLRGIFGYLEGESPSQGTKLESMVVKLSFADDGVRIEKERRWFSGGNTPIVDVGVGPGNLHGNTLTINLGNLREEKRLRKHSVVVILALVVCAGLTSWLLEIVQAEWDWVKIVAIPGLHACLVLLVGIPLYYDSHVNQPAKHMTLDAWDLLLENTEQPRLQRSLHLLQVNDEANDRDILHMLGNPFFLDWYFTKALLIALSVYAAVAYICQYAIIKDPKFDDSAVGDSEIVNVNNTGSETLTFPEFICNLTPSAIASTIPWWAIHYLLTKPLKEIVSAAAWRTEQDTIPLDANVYVLKTLDFGRILRRRWIETGDDGAHMMVLALHQGTNGVITPFILIDVGYTSYHYSIVSQTRFCFAEAQWPPRLSGAYVRSTCTLFAVDKNSGARLHLKSRGNISSCDDNCPWPNEHITTDHENPNTGKYLGDRSRVCRLLQSIARDNSLGPKFTPGWENAVHISGSDAKPASRRAVMRPWVADYHMGIRMARTYIESGFLKEKEKRRSRPSFLRHWRHIFSNPNRRPGSRSREEAVDEDSIHQGAAVTEEAPGERSPTTSRV